MTEHVFGHNDWDDVARPDEIELNLPAWMESREFILVDTVEALRELVDQAIASGLPVAIDTETEGLDLRVYNGEVNHKLVGFSFAWTDQVGYYVPVRHYEPFETYNLPLKETLVELERLIRACETWWFNAGYDHEVLFLAGLDPTLFLNPYKRGADGKKAVRWEDWSTAYNLIWSHLKRNKLKLACQHLLDPEVPIDQVKRQLEVLDVTSVTAEELTSWFAKRMGHPIYRHSMQGMMRRFPALQKTLRPLGISKLFETLVFKMIELPQLFTPEDLMRSKGQLNFAWLNPEDNATKYAASDAIVTLMIGTDLRTRPLAV